MNAFPVCPVRVLKVSMFAVVEVAPIVTTDLTSAVVVPIATLSVWVVRRTSVPSSVHPWFVSESVPQIRFPLLSVSIVLQLVMVDTVSPPAGINSPLSVLVAVFVWRIFPPEIVRPDADERPPVEIPPTKVEVAVDVALTIPNPGEVEAEITPLLKDIKYCPERDDVDTFWLKMFQSVESRNPLVEALDVEIANTPLSELYDNGANAERDVEDTLLLNVV